LTKIRMHKNFKLVEQLIMRETGMIQQILRLLQFQIGI
jgi:hypothetical protein